MLESAQAAKYAVFRLLFDGGIMLKARSRRVFALLCLLSTAPTAWAANPIVRMETELGNIDIELRQDIAPITVNNFLGYVTRGDYTNTYFHRGCVGLNCINTVPFGSLTVIQGGGWTHSPLDPFHSDIEKQLAIQNEFNLPNVAGTLAMARLSGVENSATNEFYFNLETNPDFDTVDGGFTVFGQVIGSAATLNAMRALSVRNFCEPGINCPLKEVPQLQTVANPHFLDYVLHASSIRIAPRLKTSPGVANFRQTLVNTTKSLQMTITNASLLPLNVGTINSAQNPIPSPFRLVSGDDNCSGRTLAADTSCQITLEFLPTAVGTFASEFVIPSNDAQSPNTVVVLRGEATTSATAVMSLNTGSPLFLGSLVLPAERKRPVTITNAGLTPLTISSALLSGPDLAEFSVSNNCSAPLSQGQTCVIDLTFTPASEGQTTVDLTIISNDPTSPRVVILNGSGISPQPDIQVPSTFDVGDLLVGDTRFRNLGIQNVGDRELTISALTLGGPHAADFSTSDDCTIFPLSVGQPPGNTCTVSIFFTPSAGGVRQATLTITSNDPDEGSFDVAITGTGSSDSDGIPDAEENAGPNAGDGNNDGTADRLQANVTSFRSRVGPYVTLVGPAPTRFRDVQAIEPPPSFFLPVPFLTTISYPVGFMRFWIENVTGSVAIDILLPASTRPTGYLKFGRESSAQSVSSAYDFSLKNGTGYEIRDDVITLHFKDGARGDFDLVVDNEIFDPGAPVIITPLTIADQSISGGGCSTTSGITTAANAGEWWLIGGFLLMLSLRRRMSRREFFH